MIISAYLVVGPIAAAPQIQYFYALLFILAGFIFYIPFVYYKWAVPGMSKSTDAPLSCSLVMIVFFT